MTTATSWIEFMDGMPHSFDMPVGRMASNWMGQSGWISRQRTLKNEIGCVGVSLHSGARVAMTISPAPPDTGIVFRRSDIEGGIDIAARFDRVVDTRLCTVIASEERPDIRVGTTEHLLAALAGCGVSNAVVTLDGPEVPILDGSSASFVFLIDCAGVADQDEPTSAIEVLRPVRVTHGDAYAELLPGGPGLDMTMSIEFGAAAIGAQSISITLCDQTFRAALSRARTFILAGEVEALQRSGMARGGSLENAIVVDGERVLNPGGLRMQGEFVRHKLLDAVGDLSLAGVALCGRFIGWRSGHSLNNRLMRALFADDANWAPVNAARGCHNDQAGWAGYRLPAAAAPF